MNLPAKVFARLSGAFPRASTPDVFLKFALKSAVEAVDVCERTDVCVFQFACLIKE